MFICKQNISRNYKQLITLVIIFNSIFLQTEAQQDPAFPLVAVPDINATIETSALKDFVTTVGLNARSTTIIFNPSVFRDAAVEFYRVDAGLSGFVDIPITAILTNAVGENLLLVTYNVRYNLLLLQNGGGTDEMIMNTIGNYDQVRSNLGSLDHDLNIVYTFDPTDANFRFTGLRVCDLVDVSCNGSQVQCVETLTGSSVTCQSPCKQGYCVNNGTCAQANLDAIPTCSCISRSDVWYIGERCETMVALWMIILAVVGSLILIIVAVILACCFYRAKRKKKEKEALIDDIRTTGVANNAYLSNERENGISTTTAARNGLQPRLEARAQPVVFPPRSPDDDWDRRRPRRSLSSERHGRSPRRSDSFERSNSSVSSFTEDSASNASSNEYSTQGPATTTSPGPRTHSNYASTISSHPNPKSGTTESQEFGEVENDVDISMRDQGTSPIRWLPPAAQSSRKIDITERRGWLPSLGPQMFKLETTQNENQLSSTHITDTDI